MTPVCYLDMDGVLVDFVGGALAIHNMNIPHADVRWNFWQQCTETEDEFWSPMGSDFWASLSWTQEGKELLAGVKALFGLNVVILTAPCAVAGCAEGKLAWVERELPSFRRRIQIGAAKEMLAAPSKVLVDDSDANVDKFALAGGATVLVPRPWNRLKEETSGGRFHVATILDRLEAALWRMK